MRFNRFIDGEQQSPVKERIVNHTSPIQDGKQRDLADPGNLLARKVPEGDIFPQNAFPAIPGNGALWDFRRTGVPLRSMPRIMRGVSLTVLPDIHLASDIYGGGNTDD